VLAPWFVRAVQPRLLSDLASLYDLESLDAFDRFDWTEGERLAEIADAVRVRAWDAASRVEKEIDSRRK
jgi:hypothetical protein